jgi:hypothetical protein
LDDRIPYELYAGTSVCALSMAPVAGENTTGSVGAYWSHPYKPTQWEIEMLEALASAAATASNSPDCVDSSARAMAPLFLPGRRATSLKALTARWELLPQRPFRKRGVDLMADVRPI